MTNGSTTEMPLEEKERGKLFPGNCFGQPCKDIGPDIACKDSEYNNNTHYCVCTHSALEIPHEKNYQCDRRITNVSEIKRKIPIIPNGKNTEQNNPFRPSSNNTRIHVKSMGNDTSGTDVGPTVSKTGPGADIPSDLLPDSTTVLLIAMLASVLLVLTLILICCRRRKRFPLICLSKAEKAKRKDRKMRSIMLPLTINKELFDEERYTSNPLYTSANVASTECLPVPLLLRDSVTFDYEIGEGCFGKVFRGDLTSNGATEVVAIKVLKDNASREAEEDFMREVEIMSSFRHTNILSLLGVVPKEPGKKPWMIFEFMPHGDLAEVLRSNSGHFRNTNSELPVLNKEHLLHISQQVAAGMKYLADQRFVHRDLACRNCLVGQNLIVKIADFGMSRDVYTCDYYKIGGSRLLPVRWMSPESVMYGRFTLESDAWSYGVVLWEIYSLGKQPYFGHTNEEVINLILQGIMLIPPDNCPRAIIEIMSLCWKTEPRDRIKFSEICERLEKPILEEEEEYTLPRPPALPIATDHLSTLHRHQSRYSSNELLDEENYLQPQYNFPPPGEFREYFQPLPT